MSSGAILKVTDQDLPNRLYTAAGVRELDRIAIEQQGIAGLTLMRRAAGACVGTLRETWPDAQRVLVCCGSGNNAGDGYIVAGMLAEKGLQVEVAVVGEPEGLGPDAEAAYHYCQQSDATLATFDACEPDKADVIVDALLGTGLRGKVREHYAVVIDAVNATHKPVLAVDIPSGLCADTGARLGTSILADVTVTFIGLKRGLFTLDGPDCAGRLIFAQLGVPDGVQEQVTPSAHLLDYTALVGHLPARPRNSHKNRFGHVLVVGGDEGMGGAVAMSAEAALRSGAGLVSVATHRLNVSACLSRRPELMVRGVESEAGLEPLLARASVVLLGPGLGRSDWSRRLFGCTLAATTTSGVPLVVDADGLNLLAEQPAYRSNWVLTPHPGEAGNLLGDSQVQADRFSSVRKLQQQYGGTVLLKGAGTVISDGTACYLCAHGNPGMSSAGMGDVLGGIVSALVAQGLEGSIATRLGVLVHAMAGDREARLTGERGLLATDLLPHVRDLLQGRPG
ncbi:MAG: NAD(P)H-hydrate dehydratase [Pseudomonadota bacterium]